MNPFQLYGLELRRLSVESLSYRLCYVMRLPLT
ncbi:hypothetical protein CBM2608_A50018 [Cupriavidus taiwanensis]|nr:hypothetical protein CBM2608_A50018 [Cupriavidus taiwanensis]